jgi:hypothetical protein
MAPDESFFLRNYRDELKELEASVIKEKIVLPARHASWNGQRDKT